MAADFAAAATNDKKFTTYQRDAESGLDYAMNRYYGNTMGRFVSADKGPMRLRSPRTLNRYAYATLDPINSIDPDGNITVPISDQSECFEGLGGHVSYDPAFGDMLACIYSEEEIIIGGALLGGGGGATPEPPQCPLKGLTPGSYTLDQASATPIHAIFDPTVADAIDAVFKKLNADGIVPILEDGFRTTQEEADRRKRYPTTAAPGLSWHEVGDSIDFKRSDPNLEKINKAMIDVYPDEVPSQPEFGGYQLGIAMDIFRGRYRESFEHAQAITPNKALPYTFALPTVNHVFKPGHRIMVQVQSTWFPLYDRNPQTFVPNIFFAKPGDYMKATQHVYHAPGEASYVDLPVVP